MLTSVESQCEPLLSTVSETVFRDRPAQDLSWVNMNYTVDTAETMCCKQVIKPKVILSECWGAVHSGEVCAILGPSGAGKTSMLNVLAGRTISTRYASVQCDMYICGRLVDPLVYRSHIAYLTQEDGLLATATPREALTFSARLRLPPASQDVTNRLVASVLKILDLEDCADILIGGGLIRGISGGAPNPLTCSSNVDEVILHLH